MMKRLTETYRIVPPRLGPIVGLAIALWSLCLIGWLVFRIAATFPWPFVAFAVALLMLVAQCITQLLPGSPTDYLEISPSGLTIGGMFGRRHRRWENIGGFSAFLFPTRGIPLARVKAISRDGVPNMGFSMGGYVKLGWFDDIQERERDLSDWFENVKAAYTGGNHSGSLPVLPEWFVGLTVSPHFSHPRVTA